MPASTRQLLLAIPVVALLCLAGCGGGGVAEPGVASLPAQTGATEAEPAATGEADPKDALVAFTGCLREQGFDIPDPDFTLSPDKAAQRFQESGIDPSDPDFRAAVQQCQPELIGILQSFSPQQVGAFRDAAVRYAACMRDHGVDLPDPQFDQPGGLFGDVDLTDPDYVAANRECSSIFSDLDNPFAGGS